VTRRYAIALCSAFLVILLALGAIAGGGSGYTGDGTTTNGTTITNASNLFTDVAVDHWAYEDLEYLVNRGIITGLPGGQFNGEDPLERFDAAAMIARAIRYMENSPGSVNADDLDVLKELIYGVSEDVQAVQSQVDSLEQGGSSDLSGRVTAAERAIADLRAQFEESNAAALAKRVQANFIISLTALLVGIIGVALATLGL